MRPDEHKKKKSDAYKKKNNIPTQQNKKGSAKLKLESNADRYDSEKLGNEPIGKNLKELLETVQSTQVLAPAEGEDDLDCAEVLSLDTSAIARSIQCFQLTELLDIKPNVLMQTELQGITEDTEAMLSDYVDNQMDTVYVVDHELRKPATKEDIIYRNTGQIRIQEEIKTVDVNPGEESVDTRDQDVDDDSGDGKEAELEDWLDSLLDD